MAEKGWPTAIAVMVVGVLALNTCSGDSVTGAKAAVGGAAVGGGIAAGAAAGAVGGGALSGARKGASKRAEDIVSGRNKPRNPRQPRTPTTQPTPSPSIPPTTTTTRPQPTPTTKPKTDMAPDWCISIEAGTCVTVKGRE